MKDKEKLSDPWAISPKAYALQMLGLVAMLSVFAVGIANGWM